MLESNTSERLWCKLRNKRSNL